MERTGIEPVTSGLRSREEPNDARRRETTGDAESPRLLVIRRGESRAERFARATRKLDPGASRHTWLSRAKRPAMNGIEG